MTHYVCLRISAGQDSESLLGEMERVLAEAQDAIPGFRRHRILRGADPGEEAAYVLIVLDFASREEKDRYLRHPLHLALSRRIKPAVSGKTVFDSTD